MPLPQLLHITCVPAADKPLAPWRRPHSCAAAAAACGATHVQGSKLRFPPGVPQAYEELAMACMEHDAAKRPTFERVVRELEAMRGNLVMMESM